MKYYALTQEQVSDLLTVSSQLADDPSVNTEYLQSNLRPLLSPSQSLSPRQIRWWLNQCTRAKVEVPMWLIKIVATPEYQEGVNA